MRLDYGFYLRYVIALFLIVTVLPISLVAQEPESDNTIECSVPVNINLIRPDPENTPTRVNVGLYLIDFQQIDDVAEKFVADVYINISWKDPRLAKDLLGKSLKGCVFEVGEIWHPQITLLNINNPGLVDPNFAFQRIVVDDQGLVSSQARYVGEFISNLEFKEFPFDEQILKFVFYAYGDEMDKIEFEKDEKRTGFRDYFSIEGWDIKLLEPEKRQEFHSQQNRYISQYQFKILAERNRGYYLWKVLLPLFFIVMMGWAVFWIDPSNIGPQIGLSTATIFTLIAYKFSLGFDLPKISYFTRIDKFIMFSTILVFLSLATAILTSAYASRGNKQSALKIEKWAKIIYITLFIAILALCFFI